MAKASRKQAKLPKKIEEKVTRFTSTIIPDTKGIRRGVTRIFQPDSTAVVQKKNAEPEQWTDSRPSNENDRMRTSLVIDKTLYAKIRLIADKHGLTIKDVLNAAMRSYIERYEDKHGTISSRECDISADELI